MKKQTVISWILGFGMVMPNSVLGQTLQEAVKQTLNTNPDVLVNVNERRAREQELKQARAGYNPTADLSAGIGHERSDNPSSRARGRDDVHYTRRETALNIRQMLFDGFGTRSEIERQQARINSSAHQLSGSAEITALQAAEAYLDVMRQRRLLELAQSNLAVHEATYGRIEKRSESGVGRRSDVDQVSGRRALAMSNVIAAETNLQDAQTNFLRVVGEMPSDPMVKPEVQINILPLNLDEAVEQAVANHPTLRSAEADVEAARAQHEASKNPLYPRFDLEFEGSWNDNLDGQKGLNQDALAMIRMRYNLINGGRDLARRAQTAHLVEEAKEVRNRTYRQVVESIRLSWTAYQATQRQIGYLRQHAESSAKTREAYDSQFNIGRRTLLDLLDSENEYFEAARAFTNAEYDLLLAEYRILAGMGQLVTSLEVELPEEADEFTPSKTYFMPW